MRDFNKKKIWIIAILISLFFHGILIFYLPSLPKKKEVPIMTVRFTTLPKKVEVKKSEPLVEKKVEKESEVVKPKEKKRKPIPKPKPKSVTPPKTVEKAIEKSIEREEPADQEVEEREVQPSVDEKGGSLFEEEMSAASDNKSNPISDSIHQEEPSDEPVSISTLKVTKKVLPEYSAFSRKRKEEGTVRIIITINNGRVTAAEVEETSGYPRLDESALRAAREWRFDYNGIIKARLPMVFKIR